MPELSIVVPTFNERPNVLTLVRSLSQVLDGIDYEIIFVDDDSPDRTSELVRHLAQSNARVRIVQRINRRGLASAVVEGFMASSAPYIAAVDGDMQHDETRLPVMLALLRQGRLDLVVGSRNVEGGGMGDFSQGRVKLSQLGRMLSRAVCRAGPSDPMSGFFMLTRTFLDDVVLFLSGRGFKILLDLLASSPRPVRFAEVPYTFRLRTQGQSKLDIAVGMEYVELLIDKLAGQFVPVSYVLFGIVGSLGVVIHLSAVAILIALAGLPLLAAQVMTGAAVIAVNFVLNNKFTYRGSRLSGRSFWKGLLLFQLACSMGLLLNLRVTQLLRLDGVAWYAASTLGLAVGSFWNYWTSNLFVWRVNRRRIRRRAASLFPPELRSQESHP